MKKPGVRKQLDYILGRASAIGQVFIVNTERLGSFHRDVFFFDGTEETVLTRQKRKRWAGWKVERKNKFRLVTTDRCTTLCKIIQTYSENAATKIRPSTLATSNQADRALRTTAVINMDSMAALWTDPLMRKLFRRQVKNALRDNPGWVDMLPGGQCIKGTLTEDGKEWTEDEHAWYRGTEMSNDNANGLEDTIVTEMILELPTEDFFVITDFSDDGLHG